MSNREYRNFAEMRTEESAEYRVEGYAATFEPYEMCEIDGVKCFERIEPTAFDECDMSDVVLRVDHAGAVFARTSAGTLSVNTDEHGLHTEADLSRTANSRALFDEIKAGNYPQMSFCFTVPEGGDHFDKESHTRVISRIGKLYDVSPVSFPANPTTELHARALEYFNGVIEELKAERPEEAEAEDLIEERTEQEEMVETAEETPAVEERAEVIETAEESAEEAEDRKAAEFAEYRALQAQVVQGKIGTVVESHGEERNMENIEVRNTQAYIDAYARYIESGDDRECRALLTENTTNGTVAVPSFVYDEIKTAWENDKIMSRVRKASMKGNLKVGFEISGTGAVKQTEGQAVNEQSLVMGIVEMKPFMIKKWVSISNQALRIDGSEAYLRHIYRELAQHIVHKAADLLLAQILACGTQSTTTCVGVPKITSTTISLDLVAKAIAELSDQAENPVVIMNKLTYAAFKTAQYGAGFPIDPFEGCEVLFNNSLTAFTAATTGVAYMIVGDLGYGALANFPDGDEVNVLRDPYTLATSNMVRFVGDQYVAVEPVAPNAFVKVCH